MEKGRCGVHGNAGCRQHRVDNVRVRGGRAVLVPLSGVQAEIRLRLDGALDARRPEVQRPPVQSRQLRHTLTEAALEAVPAALLMLRRICSGGNGYGAEAFVEDVCAIARDE